MSEETNTSETKHTRGPWEWIDFGNDWCLCSRTRHVPVVLAGNDHGRITTRDGQGVLRPITPDHPNARLIAAAPDLLELLRECSDELEYASNYKGDYLAAKHGDAQLVARCRALIAKAEGKEQP